MPSATHTAAIQAASLAALSNLIAQGMTAYREQKPLHLSFSALLQFVLFAYITTPPNYRWQMFLEREFPGFHVSRKEEREKPSMAVQDKKKLNVRNTFIKFALDQIVGGTINTYIFVATFAFLRGQDPLQACVEQYWPLRLASFKVWPLVSLLSYTVIPVEKRILFANIIGVFWGIFLSLFAADK